MSVDYSKLSSKTLLALKNKQPLDYSSMSNDELKEIQKMAKPTQDIQQMSSPVPLEDPTKTESFLRGAAQGASFGFADEITGGLESLFTDKDYEQARDESRDNYKAAEEANPLTSIAGNLVGGVAVPIPGGMSGGLMKVAAKGAAMGALGGLGASEAEKPKDLVGDIALGATLGGVGSGVISAAGSALKGTAGLASEAVDGEDMLKAFKYGLKGEDLVGKANRLRVGKELTDASSKAGSQIQDEIVSLAKEQGKLLDTATESGKVANIKNLLNEFLVPKMEELPKSLTQESDAARKGIVEPIVRATKPPEDVDSILKLIEAGKLSELTKGQQILSPKELNNLSKVLSDLTFTKDIKDKDVSKLAKQLGLKVSELTNETVPGLQDVNSKIHSMRNAQEILGLGKEVNELGNAVALTPVVQKLESETVASDIARAKFTEALDQLKKGSPKIAEDVEKDLVSAADKFILTNEMNKPGSLTVNPLEMVRRFGKRASNKFGTYANEGITSVKQGITSGLSLDDDTLTKLADNLASKGNKLGDVVRKLVGQEGKKKQAIMFTLMQQPAFREAINEDEQK